MNGKIIRKLANPEEVKELYPLTEDMRRIVEKKKREIEKVLKGESKKLILIIGPCSGEGQRRHSDRTPDLYQQAQDHRRRI